MKGTTILLLGAATLVAYASAHPYTKNPEIISLQDKLNFKKSSSNSNSNSYSQSNQDEADVNGVIGGKVFSGSKTSGWNTNGGSHSQSSSFATSSFSGNIPTGIFGGSGFTVESQNPNVYAQPSLAYGNPGTAGLGLGSNGANGFTSGTFSSSYGSEGDEALENQVTEGAQGAGSYGSYNGAGTGSSGSIGSGVNTGLQGGSSGSNAGLFGSNGGYFGQSSSQPGSVQYWWSGTNSPFGLAGKPSGGCSSNACTLSGTVDLNGGSGGAAASNQVGQVGLNINGGNPFFNGQAGSGTGYVSAGASFGQSASGLGGSKPAPIDGSNNPFLSGGYSGGSSGAGAGFGAGAASFASANSGATASSSGSGSYGSSSSAGSFVGNPFLKPGSGGQAPQVPEQRPTVIPGYSGSPGFVVPQASGSGNAGAGNQNPFFKPGSGSVVITPPFPKFPGQSNQGFPSTASPQPGFPIQTTIFGGFGGSTGSTPSYPGEQSQTGQFPSFQSQTTLGSVFPTQPSFIPEQEPSGGDSGLTVSCSGQGKICVVKNLCINGKVNDRPGLQQVRTGVQQCKVGREVCCTLVGSQQGTGFGSSGSSGSFSGSSGSQGQFGQFGGSSGSQGQSGQFEGSSGSQGQSGQYGGSSGSQGQAGQYAGSSGSQGQSGQFGGSTGSQGQSGQFGGSSGSQGQSGQFGGSSGSQGQSGQFGGSSGSQGQSGQFGGSSGSQGQSGQFGSSGIFGQSGSYDQSQQKESSSFGSQSNSQSSSGSSAGFESQIGNGFQPGSTGGKPSSGSFGINGQSGSSGLSGSYDQSQQKESSNFGSQSQSGSDSGFESQTSTGFGSVLPSGSTPGTPSPHLIHVTPAAPFRKPTGTNALSGFGTSNSNNNAGALAGSSNPGVFTNAQKPNKFNGGLFGSSGESGEDLSSGEPSPIGGIDGATASNGYLPPEGSAPSDNVPAFSRPPKKDEPKQPQVPQIKVPIPRPTFEPAPIVVQVGCAAALLCVEERFCTLEGVISPQPVALTSAQIERRAPLSSCKNPDDGVIGKCCRDPNYVDPWPTGNLPANYSGGFDEQGFPSYLMISKTRPPTKKPAPTKGGFVQPTKGGFVQPTKGGFVQPTKNLVSPRPTEKGLFEDIQNFFQPGNSSNSIFPTLPSFTPPSFVQQYFPGSNPTDKPEEAQGSAETPGSSDDNQGPATQKPSIFGIPFPSFPPFQNPFANGRNTEATNQLSTVIAPHTPGAHCGLKNQVVRPSGLEIDDVAFAEIPWQAMILSTTDRKLLCSGAIVAPNAVLTSAHCVDGLKPEEISIKAGEWKLGYDLRNEEPLPFEIVKVFNVVPHPGYQSKSPKHDIAILFLEHPLKLDQHVDVLCLGDIPQPKLGRKCISTGWGKVILQVHAAGALMHSIDVDIVPQDECRQRLQGAESQIPIDDTLTCVKAHKQRNNLCQVDVGGPLACDRGDGFYELTGIYSQDTGCLPTNQVATFALIDTNWVKSNLASPPPRRPSFGVDISQGETSSPSNIQPNFGAQINQPAPVCDCQKSNLPSDLNRYLPPAQ